MTIRLRDIRADIRATSFDYDGNEVNIRYKPSAVTPIFQSTLSRINEPDAEKRTDFMDIVDVILPMLIDWDVLDESGTPIDITAEILSNLPITFLTEIIRSASFDVQAGTVEEKKVKAVVVRPKHATARRRTN
jgi:hypothetical protein